MSEYSDCPKCGFKETANKKYKRKYTDRCFSHNCKWVDTDVREHMHVHCPACEYEMGIEPCNDYKALKAEFNKPAAKPWTGVGTLNNIAAASTAVTRKFVLGRGYVDAPQENAGGWDTSECPQCPMSEKADDVANKS